MKKPGIRGKTEASTTRKPSVPCTRKSLVSTPPFSRGPMGQLHEAWWPQALLRTNSRISASDWTCSPGSSSSAISFRLLSSVVMARTNLTPSTTDSRSSPRLSQPSLKLRQQPKAKKIGNGATGLGFFNDDEGRSIGRVDATFASDPIAELRIIFVKLGSGQCLPILFHSVHDANLIAVLEILAHTRKVHPQFYAVPFQFLSWTDTGQHE